MLTVAKKIPELRQVPLPDFCSAAPGVMVTMSRRQEWDNILEESYALGFVLLEVAEDLSGNEYFARAFQKEGGAT